jgi:hypothetical protein
MGKKKSGREAVESRSKTSIALVSHFISLMISGMKILLLLILGVTSTLGVTREVVRVFQPLSFHHTDTAVEYGPKGELLQADVVARSMVLSGAFPEDLAKAVLMPCQLTSNNPGYDVPEVNLAQLCNLKLQATRSGETVEIVVDCSKAAVPEDLEVTLSQVLEMLTESIRRTFRTYYQESGQDTFRCQIRFESPKEGKGVFEREEVRFSVGKR